MRWQDSKNASFLQGYKRQDLAEYAVMLAIVLVIVIGTLRLMAHKHQPSTPPNPPATLGR